jgi:hypothetical protein
MAEGLEFESRQAQEIFLWPTTSRPVLGSNKLPIKWIPKSLHPLPINIHDVALNWLSTMTNSISLPVMWKALSECKSKGRGRAILAIGRGRL